MPQPLPLAADSDLTHLPTVLTLADIDSLSKYLLGTYCVPGSSVGSWNMSDTDKILAFMEVTF